MDEQSIADKRQHAGDRRPSMSRRNDVNNYRGNHSFQIPSTMLNPSSLRSLLCLFLLFPFTLSAQNWDVVKSSEDYVWGEGTGSTIDEADKHALEALTSSIAVFVQSDFEMTLTNEQQGQDVSSNSFAVGRLKTYSQATLTNAQRIVLAEEPQARVGRWMLKSEVDKIFQLRLAKAQDMVGKAIAAEEAGKVGDALRLYYWGYILTQSLRYPSKAEFEDIDGKKHLMTVWIPERMRAVMDAVDCQMAGREGDDIEVAFTFRGQPVSNLDFTYFDGRDWCPVTSAQDGRGLMEMAEGFAGSTLQVRLEYEYRSEVHIDRELAGVMEVVSSLSFPKAKKTCKATASAEASVTVQPSLSATNATAMPAAVSDDKAYQTVMQRIIAAIRNRTYQGVDDCFTAEGLDIFQRLVQRGQARLVGNPDDLVFHRSTDGVVCRGLQMAFSPKNGLRKSFVEDVVCTFDEAAHVKNISFGLGDVAERDILCKGIWDESVRVAIMQFLENYKTAYALKRLDYLQTLFDDNAVIIVGHVVRNTGQRAMQLDTDSKRFTRNDVKRTRLTKEQYMKNLRACFASNEFVNIRFASNDVIKLGKGGEMYAIQIEQDYYSTTYGDHGYLFLMVDLNDASHPVVKVRTWQPEKDPNFGLFGAGDFK